MFRSLIVLLILPIIAQAKVVTFGADEVNITIRYNLVEGAKDSVPTYLRFPRAIARVDNATMFSVKAASSNSMQPDYRELEVKPRVSEGSQRIEILLNDGTVVRLRVRISTSPDLPGSFDFEPRRVHEEGKLPSSQSQAPIADLSVMRAVLQGETPPGFSKRIYGISVTCSGLGPRARLLRVYENEQFKIFQVEIENNSYKKSYLIREDNVVFKSRDLSRSPLIHVTNTLLLPHGKGANSAVMTILSDPSANINRMRICDFGDQIDVSESKSNRTR